MLKLYGYAASINVRKVLWLCEELALPYEREDLAGTLNPVGLVPVIDDAGTIVWESNVILRYLAASRGRDDLLPTDPAQRAHVEQWMDWQVSDFNNSWRVPFQALVRKNPQMQDPAAIEQAAKVLVRMVGIVDEHLGRTGAYIAGPRFTLADIPMGLSLHRWRSTPIEKPEYRNVDRYYEQLLARAGFRRYGRDGGP
jgi:glutathione S-transferase